jgi:ABC-type transport system substrate-binding protein
MSLAIDRSALLNGPYNGVGRAATTVGSWGVPAFSGIVGSYYKFRLAMAKDLLKKTPYSKGFKFTLTFNPGSGGSADPVSVGITLQSFWAKLGITVALNPVTDPAQFAAGQQSGAYQAYYWGEGPILADGAYDMSLYHIINGLSNFTHESNTKVNALVAKALTKPLGATRDRIVASAARVWNAAMYDIPLIDTNEPYISAKSVCSFATYPYQNVLYWQLHPCK